MLSLISWMPAESAFRAIVTNSSRRSTAEERLMDIPEAMTGQPHPIRDSENKAKRDAARAPALKRARAKARARRKKFNQK